MSDDHYKPRKPMNRKEKKEALRMLKGNKPEPNKLYSLRQNDFNVASAYRCAYAICEQRRKELIAEGVPEEELEIVLAK